MGGSKGKKYDQKRNDSVRGEDQHRGYSRGDSPIRHLRFYGIPSLKEQTDILHPRPRAGQSELIEIRRSQQNYNRRKITSLVYRGHLLHNAKEAPSTREAQNQVKEQNRAGVEKLEKGIVGSFGLRVNCRSPECAERGTTRLHDRDEKSLRNCQ